MSYEPLLSKTTIDGASDCSALPLPLRREVLWRLSIQPNLVLLEAHGHNQAKSQHLMAFPCSYLSASISALPLNLLRGAVVPHCRTCIHLRLKINMQLPNFRCEEFAGALQVCLVCAV